jgi:hypothetical protein
MAAAPAPLEHSPTTAVETRVDDADRWHRDRVLALVNAALRVVDKPEATRGWPPLDVVAHVARGSLVAVIDARRHCRELWDANMRDTVAASAYSLLTELADSLLADAEAKEAEPQAWPSWEVRNIVLEGLGLTDAAVDFVDVSGGEGWAVVHVHVLNPDRLPKSRVTRVQRKLERATGRQVTLHVSR